MAADRVFVVVSGTTHQGDSRLFPDGHNSQCIAISTCAAAWGALGKEFTQEIVDDLLRIGTNMYIAVRGEEAFLEPEDLPLQTVVRGERVNISHNQIYYNHFPVMLSDMAASCVELVAVLETIFSESSSNITDIASFLFTGQHYSVTFWKKSNLFYLFNSHGVNPTGVYDLVDETQNVSRLFCCTTLGSLVKLLLSHSACDGQKRYFVIYHLQFNHVLDSRSIQETVSMEQSHETAPTKPVDQAGCSNKQAVPVTINPVRGRPKKVKRGRPATPDSDGSAEKVSKFKSYRETHREVYRHSSQKYRITHLDKLLDDSRKYQDLHPEVNRLACQRYQEAHPEVNRLTSQRYQEAHPEVNRLTSQRYQEAHPEVNRQTSHTYEASHSTERSISRQLPANLRNKGLIGKFNGDLLNHILLFKLKNPSLLSPNCHKCVFCKALLFEEERDRKMWCCGQGKYNVLNLPDISTASFYEDNAFRKHMRFYNDMFAFSALVIPQGWHNPRSGLSFVKILGKVYHKVYDLAYSDTRFRNHSTLYIDDGEARAAIAAQDDRLDQRVLDSIDRYLRDEAKNPYIGLFKRLAEEPSDSAHIVFENTTRRTHGPNVGETPNHSEVAAIINNEGGSYNPRTIAIWKVGQAKAHTVDVFHPLYEPFGYPLLYPHGTPGWHIGRPDNMGGKALTLDRYTRCLLLSEPRFRDFDRLSETWLVDMYSRIEEQRLRFIEFSQKKSSDGATRIAPVDEVRTMANIERDVRNDIHADETVQGDGGAQVGRVYLPNSFTGGPRYMKSKYLDAMSVVAKKGGPTFFLTMTTNPDWSEITDSRRSGSKSQPDICSRVFNIKKQELLRDLRSGHFFGKPSYIMHVLEEQKRGLMHVHVLFKILGPEPQQSEEIDAFIRADIPGEEEAEGRLRKIVLKHMIHGPCGDQYNRTNLPCWDKSQGSCEKRFPKPCTETTYTDDHGFVFYKRSSGNKAVKFYRRKPVEISDAWVVPYNAALLLKYDCHINLELASQSKVVKYMFNYITKGVPLANIAVVDGEEDQVNEVEKYKTQRYLSSSLCSWRVLDFHITGLEPSVTLLPVHLEGKQSVLFRPGAEADAITRSSSLLLLYLDRPQLPEMEHLTYTSFFEQYLVEPKHPGPKCRVTVHEHPNGRHYVYKRQKNEKVCRMFWVAPNRAEQFYLRLLLNIYPCRGYNDLLSKGGPECTTFQQAAINLGHANDLDEYRVAMEEAKVFMKGKRLRSFFVVLCNIGAPAAVLWDEFKNQLSEDFAIHFPQERSFTLALTDIDRNLRRQGSSNEDQGLPVVEDGSTELDRERLGYDIESQQEFVSEWLPKLTSEQRSFFDRVNDLAMTHDSEVPKIVYLDGPGGYGKTLLLQVISAHIRSKGDVVLCVASSGIAALNLAGGSTAHSMFRLPLSLGSGTGYWSLSNSSERAQLIREAKLIIYDEISMCHRHLVEMLDRSLRDLMGNNLPFGGKLIIFSGDFRQCAPVVTGSRCADDVVSSSVRSSYIWETVVTSHLTQPQRTASDIEYSKFLLNVGDGKEQVVSVGEENNPQKLISISQVPTVVTLEALIDFVYPGDILEDADKCAQRAILCTLNANVNEVNEKVLESIRGDVHTLYSVDYVETDGGDQHQHLEPEHLHQVTAQGVPPHQLRLKIGSVCLVTRNLNISDDIVNGTKVIICAITPRLIRVRKPGQYGVDCEFAIPRIIFKFPVGKNKLLEMCRRQFPLMLCYAMSVHKSQGQTIDLVGVDLRTDVFSHGQLYVALSRVRSAEHIRVLVPPHRVIDGVPYVKNIVYTELL